MGSGFRVWTAGEVVSASNVNNYLQEQTVMSFAGTAARSSAIASPEEGMLSYLQDSDTYQGYDGSAWVNLGTLSGASDSGLVHIDTVSMSAVASQSLNDIFTSTYRNYRIVLDFTNGSSSTLTWRMRASGTDNTSAEYQKQQLKVGSTTVIGARVTNQTSFSADGYSGSEYHQLFIDITNPQTSNYTNWQYQAGNSSSSGSAELLLAVGGFRGSSAFDGITFFWSAGSATGQVAIYGYKD